MKKSILICCIAIACSQLTSAQVGFGLKGGVNYNSLKVLPMRVQMSSRALIAKRDITQVFGCVLRLLWLVYIYGQSWSIQA